MKKELKDFNKKGLISYILPGYKINKWLTGGFFFSGVIVILFLLYLSGDLNFNSRVYVKCYDSRPCVNPYYSPFGGECPAGFDCSKEFLQPGEAWGNEPSPVFRMTPYILFTFILAGILANHVFNNLDYDFKRRFK